MGVVRREGDWRLEKQEEGVYEITYQHEVQMEVLTPDYSPGMMDGPMLDTIPVREVDSYSEAEGLFEEMAHGGPPAGMGPFGGGSMPSVETDSSGTIDFDDGLTEELEDSDLPPAGFALVLLVAGGLVFSVAGFSPESPVFLVGAAMALGGVAIFGWAGVVYKMDGLSAAFEFLVTVQEDSSEDTKAHETESEPEKTPPTPEKMKNDLIFDRAEQRCEWCGERFDHLEVHHIKPRNEGGPNKPNNLIVLCPNHHEMADRGAISRTKLKAKVRRSPDISTE